MPIAVGTIAAKDGGGIAIAGGLRAGDLSPGGDGSGPWALGQFLIDGKAGTNRLGIFAEDAAHADGDTGLQLLSVRTDTAAARSGTDGDYQPLITDSAGRLHVNVGNTVSVQPAGSVAHDAVGTGVNPVLEGGFASAAAPTDVSADGDSVRGWRLRNGAAATVLTAAGALIGGDATNGLDVDVTRITGGGVAHDGAAGSVNPLLVGGYASAAAPTDVSADADSVRAWFLRNGAQASVITAAGALIGGDATNGLDVDVTRMIPGTGATALGKAVDSVAGATDTGVAMLAIRDDVLTTLTPVDGDYTPLRTNSTGHLWVTINPADQTQNVRTDVDAVATSNQLVATPVASYLYGYNGTSFDRLLVDANKLLRTTNDAILVDDAAFTPATSKISMAGFQADEASTDSVDEGDAGAARMTLDRKQIVTQQPHIRGGLVPWCSLDLDETEEDVKTSPGQVYFFHAANRTTSPLFLRFYNDTAANVTVGTTATFLGPFEIPANATDHTVELGNFGGNGVEFTVAISAAVTTGFAANDTGAPATNACIVNVLYK